MELVLWKPIEIKSAAWNLSIFLEFPFLLVDMDCVYDEENTKKALNSLESNNVQVTSRIQKSIWRIQFTIHAHFLLWHANFVFLTRAQNQATTKNYADLVIS